MSIAGLIVAGFIILVIAMILVDIFKPPKNNM